MFIRSYFHPSEIRLDGPSTLAAVRGMVVNRVASTPLVSVILPSFHSGLTIIDSLRTLTRQSYEPKEIIVVDSSPTSEVADLVRAAFPDIIVRHHDQRLLPHMARNVGAELAHGDVFVFTDPDIYVPPDWLQILVDAQVGDSIGIGAIACHGHGWLDTGVHICKYGHWLPGGPPRPIDSGHSAALICSRETFHALGRFDDDVSIGDTDFCWRAVAAGRALCFEPRAIAVHDHRARWIPSVLERFRRGREFGLYRAQHLRKAKILALLVASIIPVRLAKHLLHRARCAARAGLLGEFVATFPVILALLAVQLAGEIAGYAGALWPSERLRP